MSTIWKFSRYFFPENPRFRLFKSDPSDYSSLVVALVKQPVGGNNAIYFRSGDSRDCTIWKSGNQKIRKSQDLEISF